jgi:Na+/melibiose symporter-like transporter
MTHLSFENILICIVGIIFFWVLRFSAEKDEFDDRKDKSFSSIDWLRDFIIYKWDNILIHTMASFIFLFLGEKNLAALIGKYLDELPQGVDEIGSAFILGFFGSFVAEILKKVVKIIKT